MPAWLPELVASVFATIIAITLHEAAHGYAARALGDDTAARAGRLSLNPIRHVDMVGTILLPGFLLISQLLTIGRVEAMFGWAKPVPVNIWQLRNPRYGMVAVAAAGPVTNFVLALLAGLALHAALLLRPYLGTNGFEFLAYLFQIMILANLILGLFNLFPMPPLDGGRIAVGLLPRTPAMALARIEPFGLLVVMFGLFLLPNLIPGYDPMGWFFRGVVAPAFDFVLMLTGHG
jgi:Zn-dependent protease